LRSAGCAGAEQEFLHGSGVEALPNTMCTFHRAIVGLGQSGFLAPPRLVVSASALCDGNGVTFRQVAAHHGVPFVFLHVPPEPAPDAIRYLAGQLRRLAATLEAVTGQTVDRARLSTAVAQSREALGAACRLFALRASRSHPVFRGCQMINLMFPLNAMFGTPALCRVLCGLIGEVERPSSPRGPSSAARVRILWAHIAPVYDYDAVWAVIDDGARASVAAERRTGHSSIVSTASNGCGARRQLTLSCTSRTGAATRRPVRPRSCTASSPSAAYLS
jgi:benzoyl-CoA reductase/2-hydroxyglutaryl-CoA dehydratase subunit BcrC/BadD/HgdB